MRLRKAPKATQKEYEELASLKKQEKEIKEKTSALQKKILKKGHEKEVETKEGTLKLQSRANREVPDNETLIKNSNITRPIFITKAKMSMTDIKAVCGDLQFKELITSGVILEKDPTIYYSLKGK